MFPLRAANNAGQARRGKGIQHATERQSRRCLKQPGSADDALAGERESDIGHGLVGANSAEAVTPTGIEAGNPAVVTSHDWFLS